MARPVINSSDSVEVNIKYIEIFSVDLDIASGALSTSMGMFISWRDLHLTWNESDYQKLNQIIMDTNDVWMPTFQGSY